MSGKQSSGINTGITPTQHTDKLSLAEMALLASSQHANNSITIPKSSMVSLNGSSLKNAHSHIPTSSTSVNISSSPFQDALQSLTMYGEDDSDDDDDNDNQHQDTPTGSDNSSTLSPSPEKQDKSMDIGAIPPSKKQRVEQGKPEGVTISPGGTSSSDLVSLESSVAFNPPQGFMSYADESSDDDGDCDSNGPSTSIGSMNSTTTTTTQGGDATATTPTAATVDATNQPQQQRKKRRARVNDELKNANIIRVSHADLTQRSQEEEIYAQLHRQYNIGHHQKLIKSTMWDGVKGKEVVVEQASDAAKKKNQIMIVAAKAERIQRDRQFQKAYYQELKKLQVQQPHQSNSK